MPGSNRLLDHAFRSELERLSQAAQKSLQGRRRTDKRRGSARGITSPARESVAQNVREEMAMSRFFGSLLRKRSRRALLLLLDASESMEQPSTSTGVRKYDQACRIAAALSIVLRARYERVQVIAVGHARGNRSPVVSAGAESNEATLMCLKSLRPGGKPRFVHIVQRHARRLSMPTDCIVLSDLVASEWEPTMAILVSNSQIHTSLIQISDPGDDERLPADFLLVSGADSESRALDIDMSRRLRAVLKTGGDESIIYELLEPQDRLRIFTDQPFERALIAALEAR